MCVCVCVSGPLQSASSNIETAQIQNLSVQNLVGRAQISSIVLGLPEYASYTSAAILNGQELRPSALSRSGPGPVSSANGSVLLMTDNYIFVLDSSSNPGTFFLFYNSAIKNKAYLACSSAGGTINSNPTLSVSPGYRGFVFNIGGGNWQALSF